MSFLWVIGASRPLGMEPLNCIAVGPLTTSKIVLDKSDTCQAEFYKEMDSHIERLFKQAFSSRLTSAIGTERGARSRAAQEFGVSRQLLHQYCRGTAMPSIEFITKALGKYNFDVEVDGVVFTAKAFERPAQQPPHYEQLDLFSAPQNITDGKVAVKIGAQRGDYLRLTLDIKQAS